MTIEQLQKMFPDATEQTWHQHPCGGGWVQNTAVVADTAYVGVSAQVYDDAWVNGDAQVYGRACVSSNARVYGRAEVYGDARVYGNAQVYCDARISGNAQVSGNARVYGNAYIHGNAVVYDGVWEQSPFYVVTSRWCMCSCTHDKLRIGCETRTVEDWLENGEAIGLKYDMTPAEIAEYLIIIRAWDEISKLRGLRK